MRWTWPLALMLVAGCDEPSAEEQAAADARDVALVEAANEAQPPLRPVTPEPLLLPDIERFDMYGPACSYAPGTSLGARVIAREADAFMKIDGDVVRFAADPGARELPMHSRSLYFGREYSLRLAIEGERGETPSGNNLDGRITLRDAHGRVVYESSALAQCRG